MGLRSLDYCTLTSAGTLHDLRRPAPHLSLPHKGPQGEGNDVALLCPIADRRTRTRPRRFSSLAPALTSRPPLSLREWIFLFPQCQPDRRAGKVKGLTQSVDQIAPVDVRHHIGAAAEEDESRRPALRLGQVVEPDTPAGDRRWRMRGGD